MKILKQSWFLAVGIGAVVILLVSIGMIGPALAQGPDEMMWGNGYGHGHGMMGDMMNGGMMPGGMMYGTNPFVKPDPLSLEEASTVVEAHLTTLGDDNLALGEVMVFDNQAYAQIIEQDTEIGAMEVWVDPVTQAVYPEMGPNMMWNLKYGMMTGGGMMRSQMPNRMSGPGMMGSFDQTDISAEMPITAEEAVRIAQAYLDAYVPGRLEADSHADPFYGYYTLHVNRSGQTMGMLSVNGYTRQVWLHTWHGDLLEMSAEE
jgi:hypothetical protein